MRKLIPLIFGLMLLLSACVEVRLNSEVLPGNLVKLDYTLQIQKFVAEEANITPEDLIETFEGELDEKVQPEYKKLISLEKINNDQYVGAHAKIPPVPATELKDILTLTEGDGQLRFEYLTPDFLQENNTLSGITPTILYSTTMPRDVIETNGVIDPQNPHRVTWDADKISGNPYAVSKAGLNTTVLIILIVIVIILVLSLFFIIIRYIYRKARGTKRNKNRRLQ